MDKKWLRKFYYDIPFRYFPCEFVFPCRNIVFELTYNCNLSCKMCSFIKEIEQREGSGSEFKPMTTYEIASIVNSLPKDCNVAFTGGEPFVRKDIMEILKNASSRHKVTIATNAMLLTDSICEELVRMGIVMIGSSVNGPREIHNRICQNNASYDRLIESLKSIIFYRNKSNKKYPHIHINCVILKENYLYLADLINEIKDININSVSFQVLDPSYNRSGWRLQEKIITEEDRSNKFDLIPSDELKKSLDETFAITKKIGLKTQVAPQINIEEILDYYQNRFDISKWQCNIPWTTLRISPYGDVFPCLNYKIGNIKSRNLQALWNSRRYRMMRRQLRKENIFPACLGCCKAERRIE